VYTFATEEIVLMKRCKTLMARVCVVLLALFLLASVPAYCQRGTLGVNFGEVTDKSGSLSTVAGTEGSVDGQVMLFQGNPKDGTPSIVVGGEVRFPFDTTNHPREYAAFGGPEFHIGRNFLIGVHVQLRKIDVPPIPLPGGGLTPPGVFNRANMELLQIPLVLQYKFGPGRHAFIRAEGEPEFTPRFHLTAAEAASLPKPHFNYGYTVRGSLGYDFGKWYVKGTYETRYFKFTNNVGNPGGLWNWKTNVMTGGVGIAF
jgi:hypothetical protein